MGETATDQIPVVVSDVFVSVVAVFEARAHDAAEYVVELHRELSTRYANYELLLVDNDLAPEQLADVRDLLVSLPCIRVLRLTRKASVDTAIFAGIEAAIGDFVVVTSPANDPAAIVPLMVDRLRNGFDIVQGVSTAPIGGSPLTRLGRRAFYFYNRRFLGVKIPQRATYLVALSRRAVNSLTASTRYHRYLRHLVRDLGYRIDEFAYTPTVGPSRERTLSSGALEAVEMVSSYSTHPLRVVTIVGLIGGLANLAYAVYVVIINFVSDSVADGWTTTSLQLSIMFFLISVILAVQSEYVGRVLSEARREPSYFVLEELDSETLISDLQRRNVSD